MQQSGTCEGRDIRRTCIAGFKHPPEGFIAGEGCSECTRIEPITVLVSVIIQRNDDTLADNHVIETIRLVIEDQLSAGAAIQPSVDTFKRRLADILKIAVLFESSGSCPYSDKIATIPMIRFNVADFVILHLAAAILGIRAIPAAQCTAMDSVEAESVHISSHPSKGGRDHPILSPPTLMPRMAFSMICSPTFSAISS